MKFSVQVSNVLNAIKSAGWHVSLESQNVSSMPIDLIVSKDEVKMPIRLYSWAIVRSGRVGERKINWRYLPTRVTTGVGGDILRTELRENAINLLIGQWNEQDVLLFALFDPYIHREHIQSSPIQIKLETLEKAKNEGFAQQFKKTNDICIVFYPNDLMQIILDFYEIIFTVENKEEFSNEIEEIINSTENIEPDNVFPSLTEREKASVLRAIRDPGFRKRVLEAYNYRCIMCGFDLDILIAAHIISVGKGGTDETRNGMVLCPNHHNAYDTGIIGVNDEYKIVVNIEEARKIIEQGKLNSLNTFLSLLSNSMYLPVNRVDYPARSYLTRGLEDREISHFMPLDEIVLEDLINMRNL